LSDVEQDAGVATEPSKGHAKSAFHACSQAPTALLTLNRVWARGRPSVRR
jgi:hypothetical protein